MSPLLISYVIFFALSFSLVFGVFTNIYFIDLLVHESWNEYLQNFYPQSQNIQEQQGFAEHNVIVFGFAFVPIVLFSWILSMQKVYKPLKYARSILRKGVNGDIQYLENDNMPKIFGESYQCMVTQLATVYEKIIIARENLKTFYSNQEIDLIIFKLQDLFKGQKLSKRFLEKEKALPSLLCLRDILTILIVLVGSVLIISMFAILLLQENNVSEFYSFFHHNHLFNIDTFNVYLIIIFLIVFICMFLFRSYGLKILSTMKQSREIISKIRQNISIKNQHIYYSNSESGYILEELKSMGLEIELSRHKAENSEYKRNIQERLMRREVIALVNTLDEEFRKSILNGLSKSKGYTNKGIVGFHLMVEAFQKVSKKVQVQHRDMQVLINELKTALKDKDAYAALQKELEIAKKVQLSILPKPLEKTEYFDMLGKAISAKEVSGDFYDHFYIDENTLAMTVADVSGKGVPASLFMATTRSSLRSIAKITPSPSDCLFKLNNILCEMNDENMFVTMFYGVLDLKKGIFSYANAGHPSPYLINKNKVSQMSIRSRGTALGVIENVEYYNNSIELEEKDLICIYSDGITEAMSKKKEEFSEIRLEKALNTTDEQEVNQISSELLSTIKNFTEDEPRSDDITYILFKFLKKKYE